MMKLVCSLITVDNIDKSRLFYEKVLKQKVKYDFGENVTFHGDFAIHQREHFKQLIDNREISPGCNNIELYFDFDNLEELLIELKKYNVQFIHEIREQPWKQKVMRFYDPDNYIIEIGESMEFLITRLYNKGMTIEEVSEATSFPVDGVRSIIENLHLI